MGETPGSIGILVVLSGDYGDLSMADYLVAGQHFSAPVVFLLPESLRHAAADTRHAVRTYARVGQIVGIVKELSPRIVLLFSAYLLTADRLFSLSPFLPSLAAVRRLLRHLRSANCLVATNDPFCGLSAQLTPSSFDFVSSGLLGRSQRSRWLAAMRRLTTFAHCRSVHRLVGKLPHIYVGAAPSDGADRKLLTFFNPDAACGAGIARRAPDVRVGGTGALPTWVFVLSEIDLHIQYNLHGDSLAAMLSSRLADAASRGRAPILIAPARLLAQVRQRTADKIDVLLLESLPYAQFVDTLLRAEYAFYWNVFSFSTLLRLMNGRPVFFFDKGHLARIMRGYYAAAVACYFGGFEPIFADPAEPLTPGELEALGHRFTAYAARVIARFEAAPSPSRMLEELVAAGRT
jgi:hypothetical protein